MNKKLFYLAALALSVSFASCSDDDNKDIPTPEPEYPTGSIVWPEDTVVTLTDHFLVDVNQSLYIEPGVKIIADNGDKKPEIVVLGNLYCLGTAEKPVTFTVADKYKTDRFSRMWGGIICGYDSKEVVLDHAILEYGGAQTSEESLSWKKQLFKTEEVGEGVPAFHFCNTNGSFVITNCVFRNNAEDHIYITGGKSIVANNQFYSNGYDGGEAINYKSGCQADIAYNLVYDANTNGLKLSNSGLSPDIAASHLVIYNNTIVNSGWRRPKTKGGSIWLESNIHADLYNNLVYDCRYAMKHKTDDVESSNCILAPTYYFASTQNGADQMMADVEDGILNNTGDIVSATPGANDPKFVSFQQTAGMNVNYGVEKDDTKKGNAPATFSTSWDFHLQAGSPALTGGKTDFTRIYASGITFEGLKDMEGVTATYNSPAPAAYFGVYGTK